MHACQLLTSPAEGCRVQLQLKVASIALCCSSVSSVKCQALTTDATTLGWMHQPGVPFIYYVQLQILKHVHSGLLTQPHSSKHTFACQGFNTNGYVKKIILATTQWTKVSTWTSEPCKGLYVKTGETAGDRPAYMAAIERACMPPGFSGTWPVGVPQKPGRRGDLLL